MRLRVLFKPPSKRFCVHLHDVLDCQSRDKPDVTPRRGLVLSSIIEDYGSRKVTSKVVIFWVWATLG